MGTIWFSNAVALVVSYGKRYNCYIVNKVHPVKVFLDDMRPVPPGWVLTQSVGETVSLLKTGAVTDLSLDHDLGEVPENGYDVLTWLEEQVFLNGFTPPRIKIHSDNASARVKMDLAVLSIQRRAKNDHP